MAPKTSTLRTRSLENRRKAWQMKVAGAGTHAEIAERLGVSPARITQYLQQTMKELREEIGENAKQWCAMELHRLDRLQASYWPKAVGYVTPENVKVAPSRKDADIVLRIMKQRTAILRLLGGYPEVEVSVSPSVQVFIPDNGRLPDKK